jgi:hypothetical protein
MRALPPCCDKFGRLFSDKFALSSATSLALIPNPYTCVPWSFLQPFPQAQPTIEDLIKLSESDLSYPTVFEFAQDIFPQLSIVVHHNEARVEALQIVIGPAGCLMCSKPTGYVHVLLCIPMCPSCCLKFPDTALMTQHNVEILGITKIDYEHFSHANVYEIGSFGTQKVLDVFLEKDVKDFLDRKFQTPSPPTFFQIPIGLSRPCASSRAPKGTRGPSCRKTQSSAPQTGLCGHR